MKKMMVVIVGMVAVFVMAGMGYAQTPILKSSLSCGTESCKVYTLGKGTLEIVCKETTASGTVASSADYTCPTVGSKQVCTPKPTGASISVNPYDTDAVKCMKVCGHCATAFK